MILICEQCKRGIEIQRNANIVTCSCGNCEYWNRTYNQCEEPELIERYGDTGNHSDRDDTCDKWKGVK